MDQFRSVRLSMFQIHDPHVSIQHGNMPIAIDFGGDEVVCEVARVEQQLGTVVISIRDGDAFAVVEDMDDTQVPLCVILVNAFSCGFVRRQFQLLVIVLNLYVFFV